MLSTFSSLPTAPSSSPTASYAWRHSSACDQHVSLQQPYLSLARTDPFASALPTRLSLQRRSLPLLPRSCDDVSDRSLVWPGSPWVDDLDVQAGSRVPSERQLHC